MRVPGASRKAEFFVCEIVKISAEAFPDEQTRQQFCELFTGSDGVAGCSADLKTADAVPRNHEKYQRKEQETMSGEPPACSGGEAESEQGAAVRTPRVKCDIRM